MQSFFQMLSASILDAVNSRGGFLVVGLGLGALIFRYFKGRPYIRFREETPAIHATAAFTQGLTLQPDFFLVNEGRRPAFDCSVTLKGVPCLNDWNARVLRLDPAGESPRLTRKQVRGPTVSRQTVENTRATLELTIRYHDDHKREFVSTHELLIEVDKAGTLKANFSQRGKVKMLASPIRFWTLHERMNPKEGPVGA